MPASTVVFGCGQCLPCRIDKRRLWTHRIILESCCHKESSFVTLTYAPEHLPENGSLVPSDVQRFLKRLRRAVSPRVLRFFLCGEYGDLSERPHYHAAIFGLGVHETELVQKAWGLGHVLLGTLEQSSAQYIAGYVTKKMTAKDDERLNGRYPEFARMSLKPGIGALAVSALRDVLLTDPGSDNLLLEGDVPSVLAHGKSRMPLGRYLKKKLREKYGFKETTTPQKILFKKQFEMQRMLEEAKSLPQYQGLSPKKLLLKLNEQKVLELETKEKIWSKKGSL